MMKETNCTADSKHKGQLLPKKAIRAAQVKAKAWEHSGDCPNAGDAPRGDPGQTATGRDGGMGARALTCPLCPRAPGQSACRC